MGQRGRAFGLNREGSRMGDDVRGGAFDCARVQVAAKVEDKRCTRSNAVFPRLRARATCLRGIAALVERTPGELRQA